MESVALEEKIHKIRLKNEEIKRRHEEVEADKKNAAELDALAEPIPSDDWPIRKEPPEFSAPVAKQVTKPKHSNRKHTDLPAQFYSGSGEGKKTHTFADGQGPPPDPKYNFLADSERDECTGEVPKDAEKPRGRNKTSRDGFKRRGSGRDWHAKEQWSQHENTGHLTQAEYEAWRAERNRIDEARISRQRTAEGNWRREWDNDKMHLADDMTKHENRVTLGEVVARQEHNESERHYRSPRAPRNSHQTNARESHPASNFSETMKNHGIVTDSEKRLVIATEKSIKVLLNPQGATPPRSSVMSVKVSSPNIAGTGRVGPRQRPRVMYSSQSENDSSVSEVSYASRQKSIDENSRHRSFEQTQKNPSLKSPRHQRRSEGKTMYPARKDNGEGTMRYWKRDDEKEAESAKSSRKEPHKFSHVQKHTNPLAHSSKFSRGCGKSGESFKNDFEKTSRGQISTNVSNALDDKSNDFLDETKKKDNENIEYREAFHNMEFGNFIVEDYQKTINCTKLTDLEDTPRNIGAPDDRAIDRSVNSETRNHDGGFVEPRSNESIRDISDNPDVEKSKIDKKSTQISIDEIHDDAGSFPNDSENAASIVHSPLPEGPAKISANETSDAESAEKITSEAQKKDTLEMETSIEIPKMVEKSEEPAEQEVPIVTSSVKIDGDRTGDTIEDCNDSVRTIEEIEEK